MNPSETFFFDHAGYSQDPKFETQAEAQIRNARELASVEQRAYVMGMSWEWSMDGNDSSQWSKAKPYTPTWQCFLRDSRGYIVESLSGIDFGHCEPWSQPYRRVVQAELARQHFMNP